MKKNILLIVAIALVGTMTFTLSNLRAQNDATPGAPPAGQAPPPGRGPAFQPGPRGRPGGGGLMRAVFALRQAKAELERSKEDYDGHRQTAIDACDKALQELEAVQASIKAAAAAKAAAAQQQAPPPAAPASPATPAAPPQ